MESETKNQNQTKKIKIKKYYPRGECIYVHMPNGDFMNIHSFHDAMYITVWSREDTLKEIELSSVTRGDISISVTKQNTQKSIVKKHRLEIVEESSYGSS